MPKRQTYNLMILLGTGAVGDFVMMLDMAIRAHTANGMKSIVLVKGNEKFLSTFVEPYPFVRVVRFSLTALAQIFLLSFVERTCIMWETANQGYGARVFVFLRVFHHFTPARIIALQTKDEFSFLGDDAIPFRNDRYMYQVGIQMLEHAGLQVKADVPHLNFKENKEILKKNMLDSGRYLVVCPTTSGFSEILRTLPDRRWGHVINETLKGYEGYKVVFIGGPGDKRIFDKIVPYLEKSIQEQVLMFQGELSASDMMTLFSNASLLLGLRTGTTLVATCIHMKGKIILLDARMKETIWFYDFNKDIISLTNREECRCRDNSMTCYVRDEEDRKLYHRCNYFVTDDEIVKTMRDVLKMHD